MTASECISYIDAIEPNAYTSAQKLGWLNEIEGKVYTQLFLVQPNEFAPVTDDSRILSLPAPYDRMYSLYLQAMIHYANGEYDRYANSMAVFNQAWGEANRWFGGDFDVTDRLRNRSFEVQITPDLGDMTIMEIPDGCALAAGRITVRKPEPGHGKNYQFTRSSAAQTYCYKIDDTWYSFDLSDVAGLDRFADGDRLSLFTDAVTAYAGGSTYVITPTANSHTGTELDWTCGIQAWINSSDQTIGSRQLLTENGSIALPMISADAGKTLIGVTIGPGIWDFVGGYDLYDGVVKLTGRMLIPAEKWYYDDKYARRRDARWHG